MRFTSDIIDEKVTREQERDLAIELLDKGCFWLDNVFCHVVSIERNDRHYFINYEDRLSIYVPIKHIIVAQLRRVK